MIEAPAMMNSFTLIPAHPHQLKRADIFQNGGCHVVVAAPKGLKMDLAKKLGAGDVSFGTYFWTLTPELSEIGLRRAFTREPRSSIRENQG